MNSKQQNALGTLGGNLEPWVYRLIIMGPEGEIVDELLTSDWSDVTSQMSNYNDNPSYLMLLQTMEALG